MLARLGRQVSMQDELAGIHAELFPRSKLRGILSACREVDRLDVETLHLDHGEPRRDQGLVRWRMGVDVQTIGHAKVKIDLGCVARGNVYLIGVKELHRSRIGPLIGPIGQRQGLVLYYLPGSGQANKPKYGGEAEHAICLRQPMPS